MKNNTSIKVPMKYQPMIDEIISTEMGFSETEYTVFAKQGYCFEATEGHTGYGHTHAEVLQDIRLLSKCSCEECSAYWNAIEKESNIIKEEDKEVSNLETTQQNPSGLKFKVTVLDLETKEQSANIIVVRKNTSLKTVVLKGVEKHINEYATDSLDFMSEVKSLHREAYDLEDFTDWLNQDLDMSVSIADLNNHKFYNTKYNEYTDSYTLGYELYKEEWKGQFFSDNAIRSLDEYLPSQDAIIERGNLISKCDKFSSILELEE